MWWRWCRRAGARTWQVGDCSRCQGVRQSRPRPVTEASRSPPPGARGSRPGDPTPARRFSGPQRRPVALARMEHSMAERLADLAERKNQASTPAAREPSRSTTPRQDDRPRADRVPARRRLVPGARHAGPPPGPRHGPRGQPPLHRRGDHRLRHDRRPPGVHLQPGLHRLRRRPGRGVRREDPQGHGPGRLHRGPHDRAERRRGRPHPRGRGVAALLRRHLPSQRARLGRDPPDQRHLGPVRRRAPSTRRP